jgi:hypothetical protein
MNQADEQGPADPDQLRVSRRGAIRLGNLAAHRARLPFTLTTVR